MKIKVKVEINLNHLTKIYKKKLIEDEIKNLNTHILDSFKKEIILEDWVRIGKGQWKNQVNFQKMKIKLLYL